MGKRDKRDFVRPVDPLPEERQPGPQTRWPGPGEQLLLYPAEREVLFYRTHFVADRTRPCLHEMCACRRADLRLNTKLVGWILAWEKYGKLVLANVTHNAYKFCKDLQDKDLDLRRCELLLTRVGTKHNGRVYAKVFRHTHNVDKFPPVPYSQRDQLLRLWFKQTDDYQELNQVAEILHQLGSRDPDFELARPLDPTTEDEG